MKKKLLLIICLAITSFGKTFAQEIKVNQLGFYRFAQKLAVIPESEVTNFQIIDSESGKAVFSGDLSAPKTWENSGESNITVADFSEFTQTGNYYLQSGTKQSHIFEITQEGLYRDLSIWSAKSFYLWRASTAIESQYATFNGVDFARPAGHMDTAVLVHSSAKSEERPTGFKVSSSKGWYDAGDYNKYVVNASPALFPMLHAYELFPDYYSDLDLNIPESSNSIPDLLDEAKWEIDWLLTMQDPHDGGVYFKLTTKSFSGMIMPHNATSTRYLTAKSTSATLDFAAMLAKASRIFTSFENELPGFSKKCLDAAEFAYTWALANPDDYFSNPSDIVTGGYGDVNLKDEFYWARAELYLATNNTKYLDDLGSYSNFKAPDWQNISAFALFSLMNAPDTLSVSDKKRSEWSDSFFNMANKINATAENHPYKITIDDYYWGSNGVAVSMGMVLATAYLYSEDEKYLNTSLSMLDYLLGRNATPYSFITGFGDKSPQHIHDRRTESDGISAPLPGYLAGGPNAQYQSTDCGVSSYPSKYPAKSYLDAECSYSTNEIAINWNGPLVFLTGAVEATLSNAKLKPQFVATDTSGKVINITYSESLKSFAPSDISCTVTAEGAEIAVDIIQIHPKFDNTIQVLLQAPISAEENRLSISSGTYSVSSKTGKQLKALEHYSIINNVTGADPVIISAETSTDGLSVILSFNKALQLTDTLFDSFTVIANSDTISKSAVIDTENPEQISIKVSQVYMYDIIRISYKGSSVTSTENGELGTFANIPVKNNAPESPSKLITADMLEDGYTIVLEFDKYIKKGSAETAVSIRHSDRLDESIAIAKFTIDGNRATLVLNERLSYDSDLIISHIENGLTTLSGDPIFPFTNIAIENTLPAGINITLIDQISAAKIEAESYLYNFGFQTESCSDKGKGLNIGYTDTGDWVDYPISVVDSGLYTVECRVASETTESNLILQIVNGEGNTKLTSIKTPKTGGWQRWHTVSATVRLQKGDYMLRVYAQEELFNLNWLQFTYKAKEVSVNVENAETTIFPNPCRGEATIKSNSAREVLIINESGKVIDRFELNSNSPITVEFEKPGIYFIKSGKEISVQIVH